MRLVCIAADGESSYLCVVRKFIIVYKQGKVKDEEMLIIALIKFTGANI